MLGALTGYLIRLVCYAVVLGVVSRLAEYLWVQNGLDGSVALQPFHDTGVTVLVVAPVVLALAGARRVRAVAIFVTALLVGAALTAPFAFARFAGG